MWKRQLSVYGCNTITWVCLSDIRFDLWATCGICVEIVFWRRSWSYKFPSWTLCLLLAGTCEEDHVSCPSAYTDVIQHRLEENKSYKKSPWWLRESASKGWKAVHFLAAIVLQHLCKWYMSMMPPTTTSKDSRRKDDAVNGNRFMRYCEPPSVASNW